MKRIVICGNYGGINTGDEAMLEGLLHVWRNKANITVLSHNPSHTRQHYGVKAAHVYPMGIRSFLKHLFNGEMSKTKKIIEEADLFVLGGGTLFADDESKRAPYMWASQLAIPALYKVPYVMLGQSVGPLKEKKSQEIVKQVFSGADKIILRDRHSKHLLENLGLIGLNKEVTVAGDLALLLKEKYADDYSYSSNDIIFIPRDWGWSNSKIQKIKNCLQSSGPVKAISFSRDHESFEEQDMNRKSCPMPEEIMQTLEKAKLVVSMRLHGNILAAINGTPFIALSYSSKVRAFCEEISHKAVIDFDEVDEETLKEIISEVSAPDLENKITKLKEVLNDLIEG